jgi:hypothetical protein
VKAAVVKTDGTYTIVDSRWDYDELSKTVGGYIEAISLGSSGEMFLNEEGKLFGLKVNYVANGLASEFDAGLSVWDNIVGDVVVFGPMDENGDNTDVTDQIIKFLDRFAF